MDCASQANKSTSLFLDSYDMWISVSVPNYQEKISNNKEKKSYKTLTVGIAVSVAFEKPGSGYSLFRKFPSFQLQLRSYNNWKPWLITKI